MYCENCQREVASTKNPHTGLLQCSHCGAEKRSTVADANSSIAETAHALLKRWEQSRGQAEPPPATPRKSQPLSVEDALATQPALSSEAETYRLGREEDSRRKQNSGIDITAELLENADDLQSELAAASHREDEFAISSRPVSAERKEYSREKPTEVSETFTARSDSQFSLSSDPSSATEVKSGRDSRAPSVESKSVMANSSNDFTPDEETFVPSRKEERPTGTPSYTEALLESLQSPAREEVAETPKPPAKASEPAAKRPELPTEVATEKAAAPVRANRKADADRETTESLTPSTPAPERAPKQESTPAPQPAARRNAAPRNSPQRQGQVRFAPPAGQNTDFDVQQAIERHHRKQRNWSAIIGQLLALGGAVCMTGGIAVVIGNRFGSLEVAEATGWLALAGGHLLFILGIYTHLTSRVEQIWQDVHHRSDELARILLQQQRSQEMLYRASNRETQTDDEYGMGEPAFERKQFSRSA